MIIFRIIVIWCQWKVHSLGEGRFYRIVKFMSYQKYSLIVITIILLVSPAILFNWGYSLTFSKPGLDWYDPDLLLQFQVKNLTTVRVVESIISLAGLYFLRSFPAELRIAKEYTILTSVNFVTNWYYEIRKPILAFYPDTLNFDCSFFNVRSEFCGDMLRSTLFTIVIAAFLKVKRQPRVPPDRIHIFQDFTFDYQCAEVFTRYIAIKHPSRVEELAAMMHSMKSMTVIELIFDLDSFNHEFKAFKQTVAFKALKRMREDSNSVEKIGYVVDR